MAHIQYMDELIKEYLLFRGFTQTLRTLENDLKIDKDKGFRVDRLTDQIVGHIQTYDLQGLRDLWNHLDRRLFMRLNPSLQPYVRKLETSLLRLYVVNTVQTNKPDKLIDFFDKMAAELQMQPEWRDWFVLPYLKAAEDHPIFGVFFSRQWQDTLFVSFNNFLAIIFQQLQLPALARYEEESRYCSSLQAETELLRARIAALTAAPASGGVGYSDMLQYDPLPAPSHPAHPMDDFYNIAQESSLNNEGQLRSLKSLFGFGVSSQQQQHGGAMERGRAHHSSATQGGVDARRTSSQAPPLDRRRGRSSSLAASTSRGAATDSDGGGPSQSSENLPAKRLSQTSVRRSRSPPRGAPTQDVEVAANPAPFVVEKEVVLQGPQAAVVTCAMFGPAGNTLATGDTEGTVSFYSLSGNKWQRRVADCGLQCSVVSLEWLGVCERLLLVAGQAARLTLWDVQEGRAVWAAGPDNTPSLRDKRLLCVRVTPSAASAILSVAPRSRGQQEGGTAQYSTAPALLLLDVKTMQVEATHQLSDVPATCLVINHNGSLVVCGGSDGRVRIVDVRSGDVLSTWTAHRGQLLALQLSHHQDKLYSVGSENKLSCWSLAQTGQLVQERPLHRQAVGPFPVGARPLLLRPCGALFVLHDDDKYAFTCSSVGSKVYQVSSGGPVSAIQEFGEHHQQVLTLAWRALGQGGLCATASLDGSLHVTELIAAPNT